jgi:PTH1 family peptidyl-tRNA hydrolase
MIIIIGLGNPGKKYENTRHNVGFMAIDKFAEDNNFPKFELQKKFDALVFKNEDVLLAKPETFMNESGVSAKKLLSKTSTKDIIVIHDDIDLPVGKIKIVKDRGSAGHKGVESIIHNIGNNNLIRIRIGIAGPSFAKATDGQAKKIKAKSVVLKKFSPEEQTLIKSTIEKVVQALNLIINEGLDKAMNEYNK